MSTTTDMTEITDAVGGITIDGPSVVNEARDERVDRLIGDGIAPPPTVIETTVEELEQAHAKLVAPKDSLFDDSGYIDVPIIDGQPTDELVIAFSGSIKYAATDPAGQALFRSMKLGRGMTLTVEGVVSGKNGGYKMVGVDTDAEREVITGKATLKITDLYTKSPEEL